MAISYLVEVCRREEFAGNFIEWGTYMTLFPHLVAGPIVRYSDIGAELKNREVSLDLTFNGLYRFSLGLAKKVILANSLGVISDKIFALPSAELTTSIAWLGMVCYTLQIYFDFAGYSDMAIGLALIFGFHFPENFKLPYQATSITEFWQRWHVSLSSWFRDFLYIPLGGNRHGLVQTCHNLLLVFLLCGLWHGAGWTFVVWGLYHGVLLMAERVAKTQLTAHIPAILRWNFSMLLVMIGWVFFRSTSMDSAFHYLAVAFALTPTPAAPIFGLHYYLTASTLSFVSLGILFAVFAKHEQLIPQHAVRLRSACTIIFLLLSMAFLSKATFSPFIYFQF